MEPEQRVMADNDKKGGMTKTSFLSFTDIKLKISSIFLFMCS